MDRNGELVKNTLLLSLGTVVPKFITLITLPLMTAYLSTEEYGSYDLVVSFATLLIPIITLQIQQGLFRKLLATNNNDDKNLFITSTFAFLILSCAVYLPVIFITSHILDLASEIVIYVCLMLFAESLYNIVGQMVRGLGKNLIFSFGVIVYSITNLIFLVVSLVIFRMDLVGVILSLTLGYSSASIYMMLHSKSLRYIRIKSLSWVKLKELLAFSVPIVPSSISLWVVNLSDRLIITAVYGTGLNGIYSVANKIPQLYSTAYSVFNLAWTETASRASDEGNPATYYTQLFRGLFRFLIGIMLCLLAVTPLVFLILVDPAYSDAYFQIPFLYFGVFFNSIVQFYSGIYIALKQTKSVGLSSFIGAVLNAVINLLLIRRFRLYAASVSTLLSYLCIALYRKQNLNKYIAIKYYYKEISIGMTVFIVGAFLCYQNNIICSLICGAIAMAYNLIYNKRILESLLTKVINVIRKS